MISWALAWAKLQVYESVETAESPFDLLKLLISFIIKSLVDEVAGWGRAVGAGVGVGFIVGAEVGRGVLVGRGGGAVRTGVLVGFGAGVGVGVRVLRVPGMEPIIKYGLVPIWLISRKYPQKLEGERKLKGNKKVKNKAEK